MTKRARIWLIATGLTLSLVAFVWLGARVLCADDIEGMSQLMGWVGGIVLAIAGALIALVMSRPDDEVSQTIDLDRAKMIERVRADWGCQALCSHLSLEGLESRQSEVVRGAHIILDKAWRQDLADSGKEWAPIPRSREIADVYDDAGGSLLVVGKPGAGKTIALQWLIEDLLARAEKDANRPVPVAFSLAEWSRGTVKNGGDLVGWMAGRIRARYELPHAVALAWIEQGMVIPMLDGLDEVQGKEAQITCIEAVNGYLQSTVLPTPCVTCRVQDYEALVCKARLSLDYAVELLPLEPDTVSWYLYRTHDANRDILPDGAARLHAIRSICFAEPADATLVFNKHHGDLARSPLTLWLLYQMPMSVLLRASGPERGLWPEYVASRFDSDHHVQQLLRLKAMPKQRWRRFVRRMFTQSADSRYVFGEDRVTKVLSWLAHQKTEHDIKPLFIEDMQPSWLAGPRGLLAYYAITGAVAGTVVGIIGGAIGGAVVGLGLQVDHSLAMELLTVLLAAALGVVAGIVLGYLVGIVVGTIRGAMSMLQMAFVPESVHRLVPPEQRDWAVDARSILIAMAAGLALGVVCALAVGLLRGGATCYAGGAGFGLSIGVAATINLLRASTSAPELRSGPNRGVRGACRETVVMALCTGLIASPMILLWRFVVWPQLSNHLAATLAFSAGMLGAAERELAFALPFLICLPFFTGGAFSGNFYLEEHVGLRLTVRRLGLAPLFLDDLLDQAVSLGLLRRVGAGFEFWHPTMQAWFAVQWPELDKDDRSQRQVKASLSAR